MVSVGEAGDFDSFRFMDQLSGSGIERKAAVCGPGHVNRRGFFNFLCVMMILRCGRSVKLDNLRLVTGCRYVMPDGPALAVAQALAREGAPVQMSGWGAYDRRYGGQDATGKRVLVYRHGAFGDALMVTIVVREIRRRWPGARVDVCSDECVRPVFRGLLGDAGEFVPTPLTFDTARSYDWVVMYEGMLENNSEEDQGCAVDDLLEFAGLVNTPDEVKRPWQVVLPGWIRPGPGLEHRRYAVYQVGAANPVRSVPMGVGMRWMAEYLKEFPGDRVVLVGNDKGGMEDLGMAGVVNLVNRTEWMDLVNLVAGARVVVAPDSAVGHLAGAFPEVPCVSLWGPFAPEDRVKYYRNHFPVVGDGCPHAPCRCHEFKVPVDLCRAARVYDGKSCGALLGLDPAVIMARVLEGCRKHGWLEGRRA